MRRLIMALAAVLILAALAGCGGDSGSLRVQVAGNGGAPVAGAKVVSNTQPENQLKVTGITAGDGYVRYDDIRAGEYSFYVSAAGYEQQEFTVTVKGGKANEITITMTPG